MLYLQLTLVYTYSTSIRRNGSSEMGARGAAFGGSESEADCVRTRIVHALVLGALAAAGTAAALPTRLLSALGRRFVQLVSAPQNRALANRVCELSFFTDMYSSLLHD